MFLSRLDWDATLLSLWHRCATNQHDGFTATNKDLSDDRLLLEMIRRWTSRDIVRYISPRGALKIKLFTNPSGGWSDFPIWKSICIILCPILGYSGVLSFAIIFGVGFWWGPSLHISSDQLSCGVRLSKFHDLRVRTVIEHYSRTDGGVVAWTKTGGYHHSESMEELWVIRLYH